MTEPEEERGGEEVGVAAEPETTEVLAINQQLTTGGKHTAIENPTVYEEVLRIKAASGDESANDEEPVDNESSDKSLVNEEHYADGDNSSSGEPTFEEPAIGQEPVLPEEPISNGGHTISQEPTPSNKGAPAKDMEASEAPIASEEPSIGRKPSVVEEHIFTKNLIIARKPIARKELDPGGPLGVSLEPVVLKPPTAREELASSEQPAVKEKQAFLDKQHDTNMTQPSSTTHDQQQTTISKHSTNEKPTRRIRILVVGPIGSGKSSFVAAAIEPGYNVEIGHGADSCTHHCTEYPTRYSCGHNQIFLVDTPGFEDSQKRNADILKEIDNYINDQPRSEPRENAGADEPPKKISGVIYLHRCTDTRFDGDLKLNFEIIKAICGPQFYSRIVICSTFWNKTTGAQSPEQLQQHKDRMERFLEDPHTFGEVMRAGAEHREFWEDTHEPCSDILRHFLSQRNVPHMAIQDHFRGRKADEMKVVRVDGGHRGGWVGVLTRAIDAIHGNSRGYHSGAERDKNKNAKLQEQECKPTDHARQRDSLYIVM